MFKFILPKMTLRVEKWKWNKEFRVYVSNLGNFKDEHKNIIPFKIGENYISIRTPYGMKLAHRLVMMTWRPIPNAESLTVDHLNHNRRDNSIYNLEWVTQKENKARAFQDLCGNNKEVKYVRNAFEVFIWCYTNLSAIRNNGTPKDINKICDRIDKLVAAGKPYCGYIWKYSER